jgi:hypothetical protein
LPLAHSELGFEHGTALRLEFPGALYPTTAGCLSERGADTELCPVKMKQGQRVETPKVTRSCANRIGAWVVSP